MAKADKDLFRELGIKVPGSFSDLQEMCQQKIRKMIDRGWDTGNDPANLAAYQKWEQLKTIFLEETAYRNYLREKIAPLIKDFVGSIDLGGWVKNNELKQRVNRFALAINLDSPLALRMTKKEINRRNLRLIDTAPSPEPVENLVCRVIAREGKVELRWRPGKHCSHYLVCRKTTDNPPRTHRDGLIETLPATVTHFSHRLPENEIGASFCYVVFAYQKQNDKSVGQSVDVCCPGSIDAGSVTACQKHGEMEIRWQPLANASIYEIEINGKRRQCAGPFLKFTPENSSIEYRIWALYSTGVRSEPATGICAFVFPPEKSPAISLAVSQDNIRISWPSLSGKGWLYRLMRCTSSEFGQPVEIYSGASCQVDDPSQITTRLRARSGVPYYYAVYPYHEKILPCAIAEIPKKLAISTSGPAALPQAVTDLEAKQRGRQVELSWRACLGSIKSHVFKGSGSTVPSVTDGNTAGPGTQYCGSTTDSFYVDNDCTQGSNSYLVIAEFASGWAKETAIGIDYRLPPVAPVDFYATPARESIALHWKRPPGTVTGYSLYRSKTSEFAQAVLFREDLPETLFYEDRDISCGRNYFYFLFSKNKNTISPFPAVAGPVFGYKEIEVLRIEQKQREILLTWQNVGQAQSLVFRAQGIHSVLCELKDGVIHPLPQASLVATLNENHFRESVSPGAYTYALAIVYPGPIYLPGPIKNMQVKELPAAPVELRAKSDDGFIALDWQSSGSSQYAILRHTIGKARSAPPNWYEVVNTPFFEDREISPGESYRYEIYAIVGNLHSECCLSCEWQFAYREIKDVKIDAHPDLVELRWQKPEGAEHIALYRKLHDWQLLAQGKLSSYQDADVHEGSRYLYRLSCFYRKPDGSLWESHGVFCDATPQKPINTFSQFTCQRLGNKVSLSWKRKDTRGDVLILKARSMVRTPKKLERKELEHLQKNNSMAEVRLVSPDSAKDIDNAGSYYYPFVVFNDRAYAYLPQRSRPIPEIEGVVRGNFRFEQDCPQIRLQWDWPPGLKQVRVCRGTDKYAASPLDPQAKTREISRETYLKANGFIDDALPKEPDGKKYCYSVHRIEIENDAMSYSPGMSEDCRIAVRYAGAKLNTKIECQKKWSGRKLYFSWGEPLFLESLSDFKGDFVLAWSKNGVKWENVVGSEHNIFDEPQGRFSLSGIPRNCFVKLLWCDKKDGKWITCRPARLKL